MPIVEFIGMARSGKSTVAQYLEQTLPNLTFYPERYDLVPDSVRGKDFEQNFWVASSCVDQLEKALKKPGINLFERGVIDHIIIGKTYHKMGWFTQAQLEQYLSLLNPYQNKVDKILVFRVPVEVSVQRAKDAGKDVTNAIPYLTALYKEYGRVNAWIPTAIYLPENSSLEQLKQLTSREVQNL